MSTPGSTCSWPTSDNDWANFREWARHPDADAVIADLEADRSLTPGLSWYRANVAPSSWLDPPPALPPVQVPVMGVWSSGDVARTGEQMKASAAYCAAGFRYERLDGPGHWLQLEAPDETNRLLLDFFGPAPTPDAWPHVFMQFCMIPCASVSKTIQIRDLDDEVYAALVRRAAEAGLTVPELLRREATRLAARPTMTEWLQRTRRKGTAITTTEVLAAFDEHRGPWPDARR